jgi:CHRD domain
MGVPRYVRIAACVGVLSVVGVGAAATADHNRQGFRERLSGFQEVPALVTTGSGTFRAQVSSSGTEVSYRVTFTGLESIITQSHIHFENVTNNGGIVVFLCSNVGTPPGVVAQACPTNATSGTIEGTFDAADVLALNGIDAGNLDEFLRAVRADATYVNIHTVGRPGGEIRAQID